MPDAPTTTQFLASIGKVCCRGWGLRPGSWQSSYTQLYLAFIISALLHVGGDVMANGGKLARSPGSPWFFFSQAIAITVEDAVIGIAGRAGWRLPTWASRALGYTWTFAWMVYSLGPYISYFRFGAETRMYPFSPVSLAMEYFLKN